MPRRPELGYLPSSTSRIFGQDCAPFCLISMASGCGIHRTKAGSKVGRLRTRANHSSTRGSLPCVHIPSMDKIEKLETPTDPGKDT